MTSIDLYDQLIKGVDRQELASERQSRASHNAQSDAFQVLLQQARVLIQEVKDNNGDILRLKDRLMGIADAQKQNDICAKIKKKCDLNFNFITELREKLIQGGKIIEELKTQKPQEPQTLSKVFRKKFLAQEIDKIINQTFAIQKLVQKYSVQTNLKRIRLILPEASDEQARKLASNSQGLQQAVAQRVTGKVSKKWQYTYNDIMSKNEGIKELQAAVNENLRLIKEVLALVQRQGEMIDDILVNVQQARDYVGKAQEVLQKEKQVHKTSRKKLCCIVFLVLAILALIATPIIIKIVKSKTAAGTTLQFSLII